MATRKASRKSTAGTRARKTKSATKRTKRGPKIVANLNIHSRAVSPEAAAKASLPRGTVTRGAGGKLVIDIEKINRSLLPDQRGGLVSSMGCVSNPGGPGC